MMAEALCDTRNTLASLLNHFLIAALQDITQSAHDISNGPKAVFRNIAAAVRSCSYSSPLYICGEKV
jgi:hypothetical protein